MSRAEQALQSAILAVILADAEVREILGNPVRMVREGGDKPAFPYLEITRHVSEPAGSAGVEASDHRIDFSVPSLKLGGTTGFAAVAAIREALKNAELVMEGWRCVLVTHVFTDNLAAGVGRWRAVLRMRFIVEAV